MTKTLTTDAVVVGGGLAGLTAAVGLADSGLDVVVVERERHLGGRARTIIEPGTGDRLPVGPHILLSEYHNMLRLLEVLGTRHKVDWQGDEFISMVDGRHRIRMRTSWLPAPFHFVPSLVADRTISNLDWMSNIPVTLFALSLAEDDIARLDAVPADKLLTQLRVSQRYIDRFWAFACNAIMNVPLDACSAGALLRFYRRLIGQHGVEIGLPACALGDLFAPASQSFIEARGGRVLVGRNVKYLVEEHDRVSGVELGDGSRIEARFVVAAVPPRELRACAAVALHSRFPALADLEAMVPCPYISVFLWFDSKLGPNRFWARVYEPNDLNCDFYDLSNIYHGWSERPSLIASNIVNSERAFGLDDDEIVSRTRTELTEFVPTAARARLVHTYVNRIPMAIPCPFVGTERHRLDSASPVPGLVLAGDWLSTGLPASMESACFAGWRAAETVLEASGCPRQLVRPHPKLDGLARSIGRVISWMHPSRVILERMSRTCTDSGGAPGKLD